MEKTATPFAGMFANATTDPSPGRYIAETGVVLGIVGLFWTPVCIGAVILGGIAKEQSNGKHGVFPFLFGIGGLIVWAFRVVYAGATSLH